MAKDKSPVNKQSNTVKTVQSITELHRACLQYLFNPLTPPPAKISPKDLINGSSPIEITK